MRLRKRIKHLAERALHVRIYRQLPLGADVYSELRALKSWSPKGVLFDVGAHWGETALQLSHEFPEAAIRTFEPSRSNFDTLVDRTRHIRNLRCLNFALGAAREEAELFLHRVSDQNTMREDLRSRSGYENEQSEVIQVRTLDDVLEEQGIDFVQYLKIDTEGYDLEVLKGAEQALRDGRIGVIEVEAGFHQDGGKFVPLDEFQGHLSERDFLLFGIYEQIRVRHMQLRRCNAVFINKAFALGSEAPPPAVVRSGEGAARGADAH